MFLRSALLISLTFTLTGCEKFALMSTPRKKPIVSHSQLAAMAEKNFWNTLHAGNYDNLPETTKLLTAAYLENPNDPKLAAHLGFVHIWKITERQRLKTNEPTITNEIILAKKYFGDAVELDPSDARFLGFYADSTLIQGQIFHDEREQVRGYFKLKRAISMWPQFNYFTGGYIMSPLSASSDHFKEGLEWQWKTLDVCTGTHINRKNPDYRPFMRLETQQGPMRACWNSQIAPHNFEGFFLNMGDMLVKSGDWQTGVKIYNNAKLSRTYDSWPYRNMLENRIAYAKENVHAFQDKNARIMFSSGYGCVACHQK